MAVLVQDNEIVLTGTVGDLFWEDCFTAGDVITALAQVGRDQDVTIRLNSPGGIANDGAAIHAALAAHQGKVTVVVEGVAASAASALAMAGDEVVMSLGAIMMVHDPSGLTLGTVADHEATIRGLNALATSMAAIYGDKTGRPVAEMRAEMQAETWMTPEEAVAKGYADRVAARAANDDAPVPSEPTAFDYRLYRRPPERLVALAKSKGWVSHSPINAAKAAAPRQPTETPMAEKPKAGAQAPADQTLDANALAEAKAEARAEAAGAERARITAIMSSDEAKDRDELARHFAFETDMSPDAAKAALAKAPKAAPAAPPKSEFEMRMDASKNPKVGMEGPEGSGAAGGEGASEEDQAIARSLASYRAVTGAKLKARTA